MYSQTAYDATGLFEDLADTLHQVAETDGVPAVTQEKCELSLHTTIQPGTTSVVPRATPNKRSPRLRRGLRLVLPEFYLRPSFYEV